LEWTAAQRIERRIDHEVRARFPDGAVRRVVLLQHGDDPVIEPGELLVRVFIGAPGPSERGPGGPGGPVGAVGPEDDQQTLAAWEQAHRARMEQLRRELTLRLPMATLLEFTVERPGESRGGGAAVPRITMRDDPALATERMPPREIVQTALGLLRARYVFPERAAQAATAIEARLAAGEYDDLDEITLTERLTSQLYEICGDKHLRVRLVGPRRHEPAAPAGPGEHPAPGPPRPDGRAGPAGPGGPGQIDNFGERTGGGSHPTTVLPISSSVAIAVPFARSINPVTGTNWEGIGVVPDVTVAESEAYDLAYGKALRHVLAAGVPGPIAHEARAALDRLPGPGSAAGT
jgi:hypothetical protein